MKTVNVVKPKDDAHESRSVDVGRVNGLDSFTRVYTDHGVKKTSVEIAVLAYNTISAPGDSGATVLERLRHVTGMLTSAGGKAELDIDTTYLTPYWCLEEQIKKIFPDCYVYGVVEQ